MSREKPRFSELARQARREPPPSIDVVGRVVAGIEGRPSTSPSERWLWAAAGLSVAAAAAVLVLSLRLGALADDPLAEWLRLLTLVIE